MTRAAVIAASVALLVGVFAHAISAKHRTNPNPIQVENALPGTTSWERTDYGGIQLYGTQISGAPGDEIDLHVSSTSRYRIVVYRMGWYSGAGARQVACLPACDQDEQGHVQTGADPMTVQPQRANWPVTDVLHTDPQWTSGYYLVEAVATNTSSLGRIGETYFVLHQPSDQTPSQILVQAPVNTWEAYNNWGGRSLYNFPLPRAYRVSFERPWGDQAQTPLWWEYQLVRFLEREGYDVSYQTDIETDANPGSLLQHRLVMDAGHDEYWTQAMRDAFDAAAAGGTNLAFMGANNGYWNVNYEDSSQTIFTYKSTFDPNPDPAQKTAMFREIGRPECALEGVANDTLVTLDHPLDYLVTADGASDSWLANTGLRAGSRVAGVVGREHDELSTSGLGCSHPGLKVLFHYDGGGIDQNADSVRFTAPSGARIFASGAMQFSWALDDWRSEGRIGPPNPSTPWRGIPADPRIQQFARNMLDDLTRPQPPLTVYREAVPDDPTSIRIRTGWPNDPRVVSRLIYRTHDSDPPQLVCSGKVPCIVQRATVPGTYVYEAMYIDQWGGISAPTFSAPWTKYSS